MDATPARGPRRRTIVLPDGEMSALEFGDAARPVDVVFVHANGFNAQTYRHALSPLAACRRVLAVDLRGHGLSRLPAEPRGHRSWRVFGRDLARALATLDGPPVLLAGHSMGATSALLAAAQDGARVGGLVLFEPVVLDPVATLFAHLPWGPALIRRRLELARRAAVRREAFDSADAAFAAYRGRGPFKLWPDAALADYVAGGFAPRAAGGVELRCARDWEAANYAAQGHDAGAALVRLRAPVRVLKAERGSTFRPGGGRRWAPRPGLRVDTVADAGHFFPIERPDLLRDALLDGPGQAPST